MAPVWGLFGDKNTSNRLVLKPITIIIIIIIIIIIT